MVLKLRHIIFIALTSIFQIAVFSQTHDFHCNIKDSSKKFKKAKVKIAKADYALEIADCLRYSNDTNSIKWYQTVIQTYKENAVYDGIHRWETKPCLQIGLSYYWLESYLNSAIWLEKAIISKEDNTYSNAIYKYDTEQALYYCGKSYFHIEDFKKAKNYLLKFQKIKGDTLDVVQLIRNCK